jgi:hypothetical protein
VSDEEALRIGHTSHSLPSSEIKSDGPGSTVADARAKRRCRIETSTNRDATQLRPLRAPELVRPNFDSVTAEECGSGAHS